MPIKLLPAGCRSGVAVQMHQVGVPVQRQGYARVGFGWYEGSVRGYEPGHG